MKVKYTQQEKELEGLRKELRTKADQLQVLELQADLVPILRARIAELERTVQFNQKTRNSIAYDSNTQKESKEMVHFVTSTV